MIIIFYTKATLQILFDIILLLASNQLLQQLITESVLLGPKTHTIHITNIKRSSPPSCEINLKQLLNLYANESDLSTTLLANARTQGIFKK